MTDNRLIRDITDYIFVTDKPQSADVIFLPGDPYSEAPEHAAELYLEEFAPFIIPSGGVGAKCGIWPGVRSKADVYNNHYTSDCEFYCDVLKKCGVPQSAILRESKAKYTFQNAFFTRRLTDSLGMDIRRAIIVCKSFHARRCLTYYTFAYPDAKILVCPAEVKTVARDDWYMSDYGVGRVLGELGKCGDQSPDDMKRYIREALEARETRPF